MWWKEEFKRLWWVWALVLLAVVVPAGLKGAYTSVERQDNFGSTSFSSGHPAIPSYQKAMKNFESVLLNNGFQPTTDHPNYHAFFINMAGWGPKGPPPETWYVRTVNDDDNIYVRVMAPTSYSGESNLSIHWKLEAFTWQIDDREKPMRQIQKLLRRRWDDLYETFNEEKIRDMEEHDRKFREKKKRESF